MAECMVAGSEIECEKVICCYECSEHETCSIGDKCDIYIDAEKAQQCAERVEE